MVSSLECEVVKPMLENSAGIIIPEVGEKSALQSLATLISGTELRYTVACGMLLP